MTEFSRIAEAAIVDVASALWEQFFGLQVLYKGELPHSVDESGLYTGCVQIKGTWTGMVAVSCHDSLARTLSAKMFSKTKNLVNKDDIIDTLAEMANIIGGNIKSQLSDYAESDLHHLSTPSVVERVDYVSAMPMEWPRTRFMFECEEEEFLVSVLQRPTVE